MERSIKTFEKRLDEANDALKKLSGHLGTSARGSYKDVTSMLTALKRSAVKTNKAALADFDKLRGALTKTNSSSRSTTRSTRKSSTASRSTAKRSTAKRSTAKRSTAKATTAKTTTAKRTTPSRSRAKKS